MGNVPYKYVEIITSKELATMEATRMANKNQDLEQIAKTALDSIGIHGVDWVNQNQDLAPGLKYGLKSGLFDKSAVDDAQKSYERLVRNVEELLNTPWYKQWVDDAGYEAVKKIALENLQSDMEMIRYGRQEQLRRRQENWKFYEMIRRVIRDDP